MVLSTKYGFDARLLRNTGNPFYRTESGDIANRFRLRITNRTEDARTYAIESTTPDQFQAKVVDAEPFALPPGESKLFLVTVTADSDVFQRGRADFSLVLSDDLGNERDVSSTLLGPR